MVGDLVKSRIPPPLPAGRQGRGVKNLLEFIDSSPSPQPSPVEGEGSFLTSYGIIMVGLFNSVTDVVPP